MGQQVLTITLVNATPYWLRYLVTSPGGAVASLITNRGITAATPDLRGDAARAAAANNQATSPILTQLSLAVANQAEARHVLAGHTTPTTPAGANVVRAHIKITPRLGRSFWIVDTDEGAAAGDAQSAGFAVVQVQTDASAAASAYLDVVLSHTRHDSR